ncbi:uracil phosphoribosyltransferase [Lunatibacter salilacus]|uniref:uracil phosphoribosyltransferase n=1 Tax=Lunatibacter salilacus TaxID=2483804 RepID=UPI00131C6B97|nr:uracil phosphoribosyltransferase [Lunatibacter salilacus]
MFILSQSNSIASQYLSELRDIHIQQDRLRFRKNLERLGEIMAYEISKNLAYTSQKIETPFIEISVPLIEKQPVIISVLRAAVPFFQGVLNFFDHADCGFIGAFRKDGEGNDPIEIELGYIAAPSIEGREVILVDPMLATGKSFIESTRKLRKYGVPKKIHLLSVIASPEGMRYIEQHLDLPHEIWTCALDDNLNDFSYIIPGLGDAGDLAFGPKL